jgi:hypothetical protein
MSLNELHASHIRRVEVGFIISGVNVQPDVISKALNLNPDQYAAKGDDNHNAKGQLLGEHAEGFWRIETKGKVESKDINDHFQYLLSLLLPHYESILQFAEAGETFFDVLWQSTYLYAGTGPLINKEHLQGVALLDAGLGFDIYQIDEDE